MQKQQGFGVTAAILVLLVAIGVALAAYIVVANDDDSDTTTATVAQPTQEATAESSGADSSSTQAVESELFTAEVWADNWFAMYVNGEKAGEDSVPITTERSFNAESFIFEATRPLTIAIEAKDYKETDSGLEYIGANNQQMGDGGIIFQVKDSSGEVVAASSSAMRFLSTHRAPLNKDCESSSSPDTACQSEITDTPTGWFATDYDDSSWSSAVEYSEAQVSPKDGYDQISWDTSAALIWATDLEVDNTVLLRGTY